MSKIDVESLCSIPVYSKMIDADYNSVREIVRFFDIPPVTRLGATNYYDSSVLDVLFGHLESVRNAINDTTLKDN